MILSWLTEDLESLLASDPRARGFLWFDAKAEFKSLLEPLGQQIESGGKKLVKLEIEAGHGPMWLKWQLDMGPANEFPAIVWLPFSQEDLYNPPAGPNLRPLIEYVYRCKIWLLDGKPPTLFGFLRKHGVPLPGNRADQVQLWKGGSNSPLAKYVMANLTKQESFWLSRQLTPQVVEQALVGDPAERLLQLFADPVGAWEEMQRTGVEAEFVSLVNSDFFDAAGLSADPQGWVDQVVTSMILLEVWGATGNADDFPFITRLPRSERRSAARSLLQRWMRDRDHFESFRRWSLQIGASLDLSKWIKETSGRPQSLRKLVELRWDAFYSAFKKLSSIQEIRTHLIKHAAEVRDEASGFWGTVQGGVPGWGLVCRLLDLSEKVDKVLSSIGDVSEPSVFVERFATEWHHIDLMHWLLLTDVRRNPGTEKVAEVSDRLYLRYVDASSMRFYDAFREEQSWPPQGCRSVGEVADLLWKNGKMKRAVLVVDALRFDLAAHLAEKLGEAELAAVVADVPSVTWVGMTALLGDVDVELQATGGKPKLRSRSNGDSLGDLAKRWDVLYERGVGHLSPRGQERGDRIDGLLDLVNKPKDLPSPLALFSRDVDALGHGAGAGAIHFFTSMLEDLERGIIRLQSWGYEEINVVTDHGFLILHAEADIPKISLEGGPLAGQDARYAFVKPGTTTNVATVPFRLDPSWEVAVPPGVRSFKSPGAFFHGGATLQEVVIPHLVIKTDVKAQRPTVGVLLPQTEVATLTVKIMLRIAQPETPSLFDSATGPIRVKVFLGTPEKPRSNEKEVELSPDETELEAVTVFIMREPPLMEGDELGVQVIDMDTGETYSGGLKVRATRDLG